MKILAADGALPALGRLCTLLQEALPGSEITAFSRAADAAEYARTHSWDAAFVSGRLRVPGGTPLTRRLRQLAPQRPVIALIRSGEEAPGGETGRIAHPVSAQTLAPVLAQLQRPPVPDPPVLLQVRCFGLFDVSTPNGTPLSFRRAKSRECLAYLISRCGARCTPAELAGVLFPDLPADRRAPRRSGGPHLPAALPGRGRRPGSRGPERCRCVRPPGTAYLRFLPAAPRGSPGRRSLRRDLSGALPLGDLYCRLPAPKIPVPAPRRSGGRALCPALTAQCPALRMRRRAGHFLHKL